MGISGNPGPQTESRRSVVSFSEYNPNPEEEPRENQFDDPVAPGKVKRKKKKHNLNVSIPSSNQFLEPGEEEKNPDVSMGPPPEVRDYKSENLFQQLPRDHDTDTVVSLPLPPERSNNIFTTPAGERK